MSKVTPPEDIDHEDYGRNKPAKNAFDHDNLDHFLGEVHDTSAVGEEEGMPSREWLKANFSTKSGAIRHLTHLGFIPHKIAKHLGIKYQHAYNVANQHLKRGPNEVYLEEHWKCSHTKAAIVIDVVVRKGSRDPDGTRVLYRVCGECATNLIPGVTPESITKALPGAVKP